MRGAALRATLIDRGGESRAYSEATGQWLCEPDSLAGVPITPDSAMRLATVYACVRVLAESLSTLPMRIRQRQGSGTREATEHPLYTVLRDAPNDEMTPSSFVEAVMCSSALRGNGYAQIIRDNAGRVRELWPLDPDKVRLRRAPTGRLVYDVTRDTGPIAVLSRGDVLHIHCVGPTGIEGASPIAQARDALGLAKAAEHFGASVFTSGGRPPAWIKSPGNAFKTDADAAEFRRKWRDSYGGLLNSGSIPVLSNGMELIRLNINPDEAQFLDTRKYQRNEICALFRVPPHMVADLERATFSNIEQQSIDFVTNTLLPWCTRWEQEAAHSLLTATERAQGYYVDIDLKGRLRGTQKERYEAYHVARMDGWMSPNEIRLLEDMAPIPDGDEFWRPVNMAVAGEFVPDGGMT